MNNILKYINDIYKYNRWIDNCRNFIQYEQIIDDEDKYKKYKHLKWIKVKKRTPKKKQ